MTASRDTHPELLEVRSLTITEVARACQTDETWLVQRVTSGVLYLASAQDGTTTPEPTAWRFSEAAVVRARRVAELERTFDADPQLAALTADLLEEVRQLRLALQRERYAQGQGLVVFGSPDGSTPSGFSH